MPAAPGPLTLRRLSWGAVVLLLTGVPLGVFGWRSIAVTELAQSQRDLDAMVEESRRGTDDAETLLHEGRYDLVAEASAKLVERVLAEFEGYSQLTRKGNRFRIDSLATHFERGHAEVVAQAQFDWRWGLYDGPIEIRYYAFARVTEENECVLHFRVAEARPLAQWRFFNRFLAPILTLRMQRQLAIRDFPLPIGLKTPGAGAAEQSAGAPAQRPAKERRALGKAGLRIQVPPRAWDLAGRRVLALFDQERVGLVVESARGGLDPAASRLAAPPAGMELAVRLPFLAELLASATRPSSDIQITVDRLPRLWQNQGRLFGMAFDNHLDLRNVAGVIDIVGCRTTLIEHELGLNVALNGRFSGTAEARLFGVSFALPFKVRPAEVQQLPLRLVADEDGIGLGFGAREVRMDLEVETSVARVPLRASYPLVLPPEIMARALTLPGLRVLRVEMPRVVERGRVTETRPVRLRVSWRLELPDSLDGFARAHGDFHFEDGGVS